MAEAQARTERRLDKLFGAHAETRKQLGGISRQWDTALEDKAFKALAALLERDFGLEL